MKKPPSSAVKTISPDPRVAKLERAVRAGIALRKAMEDLRPFMKMLSVPRAAVEQYDAIIEELSDNGK